MEHAWLKPLFALLLLIPSGLSHLLLWRWMQSSFPSLLGRLRSFIIAMLVLLTASVALRFVAPVGHSPLGAWLIGLTQLWQLVVASMVIPIFSIRLIRRVFQKAFARDLPALSSTPQPSSPAPQRRQVLETVAGIGLAGLSGTVLTTSFSSGRFALQIERMPLPLRNLPPSLNGYRIAQISDLHIGVFLHGKRLDDAMRAIQQQHADLVVVTGDIIDIDTDFLDEARRALASLLVSDGIVAVLGNHDYYAGAATIVHGLRRSGIRVLLNESTPIMPMRSGGFTLAGLDDVSGRYQTGGDGGPNVDKTLNGLDASRPIVMLAHQPHLIKYTAGRVAAQLSGHTHGGQIRPGFTPTRLVYPFTSGRYDQDGTLMWVNRGLGVVGPPARLAAPAEITVFELHST